MKHSKSKTGGSQLPVFVVTGFSMIRLGVIIGGTSAPTPPQPFRPNRSE